MQDNAGRISRHPRASLVLETTAGTVRTFGERFWAVSWRATRHGPGCLSIPHSYDTVNDTDRGGGKQAFVSGGLSSSGRHVVAVVAGSAGALASYMARDEGARSSPNQGRYGVRGRWLVEWKKSTTWRG